ncbi:MAG: cupin [Bacteroidia bacterium 44-10]|nr:MAG: cupin [Bacteroidia bacterium 44-10]
MKHNFKYILPLVIALFTACNNNQNTAETKQQNDLVFPQGEKITNANFTGTAYLQSLIEADSLNAISVGNVTFEAGARSKWHTHPAGQILLAIDGVGYYQEKGKPKQILRKGDAIKCPPDISHWHGASADTAFVQIAITGREKGETVWLEEVTDEEYNSFD